MKRGTLIALGAFAILLGLVLATRERQVSVGVRKLELPQVDPAQFTALELTGARNITLRKEGTGWIVLDPSKPGAKFKADDGVVSGALSALGEVKNPDFITDRAERLAEYELDDAKGLKLKALPASGPAVEVVIGKAAKNGGVYVRKPGSNDVFAHQGRLAGGGARRLRGRLAQLDAKAAAEVGRFPAGHERALEPLQHVLHLVAHHGDALRVQPAPRDDDHGAHALRLAVADPLLGPARGLRARQAVQVHDGMHPPPRLARDVVPGRCLALAHWRNGGWWMVSGRCRGRTRG